MVPPGRRTLTSPRNRALAAFLVAAAVVWWTAHRHGVFFVTGLGPETSALAGPILPAVCAGLTAALVLWLVDLATGPVAALLAVLAVLALPDFGTLHNTSLTGPPLLTLTMVMLALMMHAPRWSLAYGTVAAVGAVLVESAGAGLPLAAVGWAVYSARRDRRPPWRRLAFALIPLLLLVAIDAGGGGSAWPGDWQLAWRGGLDAGLRAAGTVIGDQLAPGISSPAVRWFAIADLTLILLAVVVAGARVARRAPATSATVTMHPAAGTVLLGLALGLACRWLLVPASPAPDVVAMLPLVVVAVVAVFTSAALLWRGWPRWGRGLALLLLVGWLQAAMRS